MHYSEDSVAILCRFDLYPLVSRINFLILIIVSYTHVSPGWLYIVYYTILLYHGFLVHSSRPAYNNRTRKGETRYHRSYNNILLTIMYNLIFVFSPFSFSLYKIDIIKQHTGHTVI